jgi:hypothetical protein
MRRHLTRQDGAMRIGWVNPERGFGKSWHSWIPAPLGGLDVGAELLRPHEVAEEVLGAFGIGTA